MPYKESRLTPQIIADLRWRRHRGRDPRAAALIEARRDRQERGLQPSVEDALFNQIDKSKGAARRHWPLLVGLALETGARAGELLQASRDQFDLGQRIWRLPAHCAKCRIGREIPLSEAAMSIVERLVALAKPGDPRLFHPLCSPSGAVVKFAQFAKSAGAEGLRFHGLRREAFTRMILREKHLSIEAIMAAFGYSGAEILARGERIRAGCKPSA
jgi:integrase